MWTVQITVDVSRGPVWWHGLTRAVEDYLLRAAGRSLVVASHGMAMTLWLTARVGLTSPGEFWASLRFPDAVAVDLAAGTMNSLAQR
jgi:hypothetical protein